ncbi:hypothetical protein ACFL35_16750 [Candidatus Riflebacteria bacterium]
MNCLFLLLLLPAPLFAELTWKVADVRGRVFYKKGSAAKRIYIGMALSKHGFLYSNAGGHLKLLTIKNGMMKQLKQKLEKGKKYPVAQLKLPNKPSFWRKTVLSLKNFFSPASKGITTGGVEYGVAQKHTTQQDIAEDSETSPGYVFSTGGSQLQSESKTMRQDIARRDIALALAQKRRMAVKSKQMRKTVRAKKTTVKMIRDTARPYVESDKDMSAAIKKVKPCVSAPRRSVSLVNKLKESVLRASSKKPFLTVRPHATYYYFPTNILAWSGRTPEIQHKFAPVVLRIKHEGNSWQSYVGLIIDGGLNLSDLENKLGSLEGEFFISLVNSQTKKVLQKTSILVSDEFSKFVAEMAELQANSLLLNKAVTHLRKRLEKLKLHSPEQRLYLLNIALKLTTQKKRLPIGGWPPTGMNETGLKKRIKELESQFQ